MTDEKSFFAGPPPAAAPAAPVFGWAEWKSLPLSTRVADKLVEMLVAACEARAELPSEEGSPLGWVVAELDAVIDKINKLLRQLAS